MTNYTQRTLTRFLAIHCSDTPPSMNVDEYEIRQWHLARGWSDIGYNIVIPRDGSIQVARPLDTVGAHVKGFNSSSLGICLVGGRREDSSEAEDNFTSQQYETLYDAVSFGLKYAPDAMVKGHNEFPGVTKNCPSFNVQDWLRKVGLSLTEA